jgi:hypothetical protein
MVVSADQQAPGPRSWWCDACSCTNAMTEAICCYCGKRSRPNGPQMTGEERKLVTSSSRPVNSTPPPTIALPHDHRQSATRSLTEWWLTAFTSDERAMIAERFRPLGSTTTWLTRDEVVAVPGDPVSSLTNLAGWFQAGAERRLAMTILAKAEQLVTQGAAGSVLDMHFMFMAEIQTNYRDRDSRPGALDAAIRACYSQIAISRKAQPGFKRAYGDPIPGHTGFHQMAIIREKEGNLAEAISLCTRAKGEGWMGDWDARIARCKRKHDRAR